MQQHVGLRAAPQQGRGELSARAASPQAAQPHGPAPGHSAPPCRAAPGHNARAGNTHRLQEPPQSHRGPAAQPVAPRLLQGLCGSAGLWEPQPPPNRDRGAPQCPSTVLILSVKSFDSCFFSSSKLSCNSQNESFKLSSGVPFRSVCGLRMLGILLRLVFSI